MIKVYTTSDLVGKEDWEDTIVGKLSHRVSDKLCPYCFDDGPFIEMSVSLLTKEKIVRYYLECLACGNTWVKHSTEDYDDKEEAMFQKGRTG